MFDLLYLAAGFGFFVLMGTYARWAAGLTMFDLILGGTVAFALAAYLVFALVNPERF